MPEPSDRTRYAWGDHPRWPMLALALVVLVDAVDVSILRGVLELLKEDWGLSDFQLGMLGFAFIFMNILVSIPAGWMADRYKRTRIIGLTMLTWSAFSVASATAVNYTNLFAARAALGMGQAIDDPASTALLADYYPARLRGRVFSVQQVTQFVGAGLGLGLGGFVGATLGWRWAFLLVGTPGVIVALMVFRLREPARGEAEHVEMLGATLKEDDRPAGVRTVGMVAFLRTAAREIVIQVRGIFRIRTMRFILIGVSVLLFTVTGIGYWLAVYHDRYSGLTLKQATATTAIVLVTGGIIGTLWGGRVTDKIYGQGPAGRITMVGSSIIGSLALFVLSFNIPMVPVRFVLQFFGTFIGAAAVPGLRASMTDVVPAASRGIGVSAFSLSAAVFGTALAPPIVGALSDLTSSLLAAFNIVSPIVLIGALILLRARRTIVEDAQAIFEAVAARAAQRPPEPTPAPAPAPPDPDEAAGDMAAT